MKKMLLIIILFAGILILNQINVDAVIKTKNCYQETDNNEELINDCVSD